MKNSNKTFNLIKRASIIVLTLMMCVSCSSDDDGGPSGGILPSSLLGTYTGTLVYTSASGSVTTVISTGTATISSAGSNYTIAFSDDVPSLTDIEFTATDNNTFISVTAGSSSGSISVSDGDLDVGITIQGSTWAFTTN